MSRVSPIWNAPNATLNKTYRSPAPPSFSQRGRGSHLGSPGSASREVLERYTGSRGKHNTCVRGIHIWLLYIWLYIWLHIWKTWLTGGKYLFSPYCSWIGPSDPASGEGWRTWWGEDWYKSQKSFFFWISGNRDSTWGQRVSREGFEGKRKGEVVKGGCGRCAASYCLWW